MSVSEKPSRGDMVRAAVVGRGGEGERGRETERARGKKGKKKKKRKTPRSGACVWGSSPAAAALWQPLSTQLRRPSRAVGDSGRREDGQKLPFWVVGAERGCLMSVRVRGCAGAGCGRPGFSGISGFERRALQVLPMRMRMRMRQFPGHTRTHPGRPREGLYMHVTYYVPRHYPGLNSCPRPACGRPICPICPVCPAAIGSPLEAGQGQGRPGRAWIAPVGPRGSSEFLPLPIFWPLAFGLWPLQARQLRQRSAIVHRLAHSLSVGRSSRPSSSPPHEQRSSHGLEPSHGPVQSSSVTSILEQPVRSIRGLSGFQVAPSRYRAVQTDGSPNPPSSADTTNATPGCHALRLPASACLEPPSQCPPSSAPRTSP